MYTIFLPIMGNTLPITAWNHLFDILQLILATMKIHMITESGTPNQHKIYKDPSFSPYNGISIRLFTYNCCTNAKYTLFLNNGLWLKLKELTLLNTIFQTLHHIVIMPLPNKLRLMSNSMRNGMQSSLHLIMKLLNEILIDTEGSVTGLLI